MTYRKELEIAIDAVRTASILCRSVRPDLNDAALEKRDRSPVTVADFGSQALICRSLRAAFPRDPIVAEENSTALRLPENDGIRRRVVDEVARLVADASSERVFDWIDCGTASTYSDRFWTLDPIDGTKGFLRGDQYAIALALVVDGELAVAALACPGLGYSPAIEGGSGGIKAANDGGSGGIKVVNDGGSGGIKAANDGGSGGSRAENGGVSDGIKTAEGGSLSGTKAPSGSIYAAVRGGGAFVLPLDGTGSRQPIKVSSEADSFNARFCESVESEHSSHTDAASVADLLEISRPPLRMDSQAKYAVVARGDAEMYLRLTRHTGYVEQIWDHAAGALVIEEAGGRVTDVNGRPLDFRHGMRLERNVGIVATNGLLHDQVLAALSKVLVYE